jgi:hypothetical protein
VCGARTYHRQVCPCHHGRSKVSNVQALDITYDIMSLWCHLLLSNAQWARQHAWGDNPDQSKPYRVRVGHNSRTSKHHSQGQAFDVHVLALHQSTLHAAAITAKHLEQRQCAARAHHRQVCTCHHGRSTVSNVQALDITYDIMSLWCHLLLSNAQWARNMRAGGATLTRANPIGSGLVTTRERANTTARIEF